MNLDEEVVSGGCVDFRLYIAAVESEQIDALFGLISAAKLSE